MPSSPVASQPPTPTRSGSAAAISCYGPGGGRVPMTVDQCRPLLTSFRQLPNYRKIQVFLMGAYPSISVRKFPPFTFYDKKRSDCVIKIGSVVQDLIDEFSLEQARTLVQDILDYCQDHGGLGGEAGIGRKNMGWMVGVIGMHDKEPQGNGDGLVGSVDRPGEVQVRSAAVDAGFP